MVTKRRKPKDPILFHSKMFNSIQVSLLLIKAGAPTSGPRPIWNWAVEVAGEHTPHSSTCMSSGQRANGAVHAPTHRSHGTIHSPHPQMERSGPAELKYSSLSQEEMCILSNDL